MSNKLSTTAYERARSMPMDYIEACGYLNEVPKFGYNLGLNSVARLCELLGNPQEKLSVIHVAGSNGKGSTCAMISAVLQTAGYKTGMYLSPFLKDYRDSMYINSDMISKPVFAQIASSVYAQAKRLNEQGIVATEFEILTACAFLWFEQSGCDVVVLETGMGGRLDATNIVSNTLISVLTAITLDHIEYLGDTIAQVTQEKCGIIKQNSITVCYPKQDAQALAVIKRSVKEKENLLVIPDINQFKMKDSDFDGSKFRYQDMDLYVSLPGMHQPINAITAIETINALVQHKGFKVSKSAIKEGINDAFLPARQEVLLRKPFVLLDGAHNLQGIELLAKFVETQRKGRSVLVIMGMLEDKQYEQSISIMASLCDRFVAVQPNNSRALDSKVVERIANKYCNDTRSYSDLTLAFDETIASCPEDWVVVICGSLYFADVMREAALKHKELLK